MRLTLRTGQLEPHRMRVLERTLGELDQRAVQRLVQAVVLATDPSPLGHGVCSGTANTGVRSRPFAFQCATPLSVSSISAWPTASSMLRNPSSAR